MGVTYVDFREVLTPDERRQIPYKEDILYQYVSSVYPNVDDVNWFEVFPHSHLEVLRGYTRLMSIIRFRSCMGDVRVRLRPTGLNTPKLLRILGPDVTVTGWVYNGVSLYSLLGGDSLRCDFCGRKVGVLHQFQHSGSGVSLSLSSGCALKLFDVSEASVFGVSSLIHTFNEEFAQLSLLMGKVDLSQIYHKFLGGIFGGFLTGLSSGFSFRDNLFYIQAGGSLGASIRCLDLGKREFCLDFTEVVRRLPFCLNGVLYEDRLELVPAGVSVSLFTRAFELVDHFRRLGLPVPISLCGYLSSVLGSICADVTSYFERQFNLDSFVVPVAGCTYQDGSLHFVLNEGSLNLGMDSVKNLVVECDNVKYKFVQV